jgi:hypothetical protein
VVKLVLTTRTSDNALVTIYKRDVTLTTHKRKHHRAGG